jgi:hypothetical protein
MALKGVLFPYLMAVLLGIGNWSPPACCKPQSRQKKGTARNSQRFLSTWTTQLCAWPLYHTWNAGTLQPQSLSFDTSGDQAHGIRLLLELQSVERTWHPDIEILLTLRRNSPCTPSIRLHCVPCGQEINGTRAHVAAAVHFGTCCRELRVLEQSMQGTGML